MGLIDGIILSSAGIIFTITLTMLGISLLSTSDDKRKRHFIKVYSPVLIGCGIVFLMYFSVLTIVSTVNLLF